MLRRSRSLPRASSVARSDPVVPPRVAHQKSGVVVAVRVGDVMRPHLLTVVRTRHDHHSGEMKLTSLEVDLVEALPGNIAVLVDRLAGIVPRSKDMARLGLGKALLVLDCTRQPECWRLVLERMAIDVMLRVTTHGRLDMSVPFWMIGRHTLLSELAVQMARPGVLSLLHPPGERGTVWLPAQIREALAAAQLKPPRDEEDGLVSETTSQDDCALALSAAVLWAERGGPDPWIPDPEELPR